MPIVDVKTSEALAAVLRDSGIRREQLARGEYDKLVDAIASDNFDFSLRKNATGFYVMDLHDDDKAENNCPPWIPENLCGGYEAIAKFGKSVGMGPFALQIATADAAMEKAKEWSLGNKDTFIQIGVFIVGAALVIVAIAFILKDTVAKETIGTVLKSVSE